MTEILCLRKDCQSSLCWVSGGPGQRREEVVTNIISLWNLELGTLLFIDCGLGRYSVKGNRITPEVHAKVSLLKSVSADWKTVRCLTATLSLRGVTCFSNYMLGRKSSHLSFLGEVV